MQRERRVRRELQEESGTFVSSEKQQKRPLSEVLGGRDYAVLQHWRIRPMSEWNMYDM